MVNAPSAERGTIGESSRAELPSAEELEQQLAKLRS